MEKRKKIPQKLLVEGNDDMHVIWSLCQKFNVKNCFEVIDCKGIGELFKDIPSRLGESDIETLGIIIDADSDLLTRWNTLKQIFKEEKINLPSELPDAGLIFQAEFITIGVWIMPNNNLKGMLEDFISFLIPKDDALLPIVRDTLDLIESKKLNKYKPIHKSKALIHSWLAIQEDAGTPMGLSITKKYLTTDEITCSIFMDWLKRLFEK